MRWTTSGINQQSLIRKWTSIGLKLSVASCIFISTSSFFRGIAKRLPLSLLMGQPSYKYPESLSKTLWQLLWPRIRGYWQHSGKNFLFLKVASTLWGICQRVANNPCHPVINLPEGCQYPVTPFKKFSRGLPTIYGTFASGLPQLHSKGQPLCNTSPKKVKFKVKNQEAVDSY